MQRFLVFFFLCLGPIAAAHAGPFQRVDRAASAQQTATLIKFLGHKHSIVRQRAAHALGPAPLVDTPGAVEALLTCLGDDAERDFVRSACGGTLALHGIVEAVPLILLALETAETDARFELVHALARYESDTARATLDELRDDADPFVSAKAFEVVQ